MKQDTYNGWTNRETWLVNLYWSDNLKFEVDQLIENGETESYDIAESVKNTFEDIMDEYIENLPPFITDFIDFGLISWIELVEAWKED